MPGQVNPHDKVLDDLMTSLAAQREENIHTLLNRGSWIDATMKDAVHRQDWRAAEAQVRTLRGSAEAAPRDRALASMVVSAIDNIRSV